MGTREASNRRRKQAKAYTDTVVSVQDSQALPASASCGSRTTEKTSICLCTFPLSKPDIKAAACHSICIHTFSPFPLPRNALVHYQLDRSYSNPGARNRRCDFSVGSLTSLASPRVTRLPPQATDTYNVRQRHCRNPRLTLLLSPEVNEGTTPTSAIRCPHGLLNKAFQHPVPCLRSLATRTI